LSPFYPSAFRRMSAPLRASQRIEPQTANVAPVRGERSREARILIIDDQEATIEALRGILRCAGFVSVNSTTDPMNGVTQAQTWHPDLVLLALHMPGLDGFGVLDAIRPQLAGGCMPVLMLTADSSDDTKRRALAGGVKDFLTKPFDATEVLLRIENLLETRSLYTTLEQRVAERTRELEDAQVEILQRLAAAAEFRDDETGEHTQRVGRLAALIADQMGLPAATVDNIRRAAPLHDVGKIGIPDSILLKQAALTEEEQRIMRTHVTIGARMLAGARSALVQTAERIARSHHERWDAKGYPDRLAGERIPIEARVVAVADVFDALTHKRPYRPAWSLQKTLAMIGDESGGHFDPIVVTALLTLRRLGVELLD
jgi:putative two-component system response regulator